MKANVQQQARFGDRGVSRILDTGPQKQAAGGQDAPPSGAAGEPPLQAETTDSGDQLDDGTVALPYATAKAMRETFLARRAKLDYLAAQGNLLPVAEVESRWARIITNARNRLLAVAGRIGARLSHLSQTEIAAIDKEVRAALQELSE